MLNAAMSADMCANTELSKVLLDSFPDEWHARPALQPFLSFFSTLR